MLDKTYFRILDYFPSEVLGIDYKSINSVRLKGTNEITQKYVYKIRYFNLVYSTHTNSTAVNGSIRKFYFGENSIEDFEYSWQFKHALYLLSEELKIPYMKILECCVYTIEIGKNFLVNVSPSAIVSSIQKFSLERCNKYKESIIFTGSNYDFIIYDKIIEIVKNNSGINKELVKEKYKNVYYLRIELQLKKRKEIRAKLCNPNFETLHDVLALFDVFPYLLFHEIKCLEFSEKRLDAINGFEGKSINEFKEYLFAIGINRFGLDNVLNKTIQLQGVEKSLNNRRVFKKKAGLIKLKTSSENIKLLESFKEQLNVTDKGLANLEILDDEFCFTIPTNYNNNIRKNL